MSTSDRETLAATAAAGAEAAPESSDYVLTADTARILVVDDEKVIREILAEFLTLEGFSVHTVEDGEKALTELRLRPYDLLITDLKMPGVDGLTVIREAKRYKADLPVIIITGYSTEASAIEAVNLGVTGYLTKPFRVPQVLNAAAKALGEERSM